MLHLCVECCGVRLGLLLAGAHFGPELLLLLGEGLLQGRASYEDNPRGNKRVNTLSGSCFEASGGQELCGWGKAAGVNASELGQAKYTTKQKPITSVTRKQPCECYVRLLGF